MQIKRDNRYGKGTSFIYVSTVTIIAMLLALLLTGCDSEAVMQAEGK